MAVAFGSQGTVASGTTSLSVAYPASISAGDLLVLCICNKFPANGPSTPAGWTLPTDGQRSGGSGVDGNDSGNVFATVFYKEADGTESGSLSVTITSGDCAVGRMLRYTKGAGAWQISAVNGTDTTPGVGSWNVTAGADPGIAAGDFVVTCSAVNANSAATNFSSHAMTVTGATVGTDTARLTGTGDTPSGGTSLGNDCTLAIADHEITAGSSSAAPAFSMAYAGGTAASPAGATVFLRLREDAGGGGFIDNTQAVLSCILGGGL